jgi:hypothetical protein
MNNEPHEQPETFFRVLADDVDVRRWNKWDFNSTHEQAPLEWNRIYETTHSERPEDYPLSTRPGGPQVFTDRARHTFVECLRRYGYGEIWPRDARILVGELNGTCAYRDPQAALGYARDRGEPSFVVFTATLVDEEIPEKLDGGVLVHPRETIDGPMRRTAFVAKYPPSPPALTQPDAAPNAPPTTD